MTTQFADMATRIMQAADYFAFFGPASNPASHIKQVYRSAARIVHPDAHNGKPTWEQASEAFKRLGCFYAEADQMVGYGLYGQPKTLVTWTTRKGVHEVFRPLGNGDLCATFNARTRLADGSDQQITFCKVATSTSDHDLLQAEVKALRLLRADHTDPDVHPFFPEVIDSFAHREAGKPTRQVNVLSALEGFYTLTEVNVAFPDGLEAIHMAWIWRRVLWALGHAHKHGVIHGALLPSHVMILPEQHGLVLVDWCYASLLDDSGQFTPIKAAVGGYKDWYPKEVFAKQPPSPATDLIMAARCMIELTGGNPLTGNYPALASIPKPFRAFFRGCLSPTPTARPQDALQLLGEFDRLLQSLGRPYYPRKFIPFAMPEGLATNP